MEIFHRKQQSEKFVPLFVIDSLGTFSINEIERFSYSNFVDALFGILLVVNWLKLIGDSLAQIVTRYYGYLEGCIDRHKKYRTQQMKDDVNGF